MSSKSNKKVSKPTTTSTSKSGSTSTTGSTVVSLNATSSSSQVSPYDTMVASWDETTTEYVTSLQTTLANRDFAIQQLNSQLDHASTELNYARGMVKYLAKDLDVK